MIKSMFSESYRTTDAYKKYGRYAFYAEVCFQYEVFDLCAKYIEDALIKCVYYIANKGKRYYSKPPTLDWLNRKLEEPDFISIFGEEQKETAKQIIETCEKIKSEYASSLSREMLENMFNIIRNINKKQEKTFSEQLETVNYEHIKINTDNFSKFNRNAEGFEEYGIFVDKAYTYLKESDFDSCAFNIRKALDRYVDFLYLKYNIEKLPEKIIDKQGYERFTNLSDKINNQKFQEKVPEADITLAHIIRMKANTGVHSEAEQEQLKKVYDILLALLLNQQSQILIDLNKLPALHKAILSNDIEKIKKLLTDKRIKKDRTTMGFAIRCDNIEIIKLCEDAGLQEKYPLHIAAMYDSPEATKYYLEKKNNINCFADENSNKSINNKTPLMVAAFFDSLKTGAILIRNKAKINIKNKERKTALHYAIENDSQDVGALLISAKAKIENRILWLSDKYYENSILRACTKSNKTYLTNFILDTIPLNNILWYRIQLDALSCDNATFIELLEKRLFPNMHNYSTPGILNLAVINQATNCVKYYIKKGADCNYASPMEKDKYLGSFNIYYGATPLMMAASFNNKDIIEILLENNADVEIKDDYGRTFLMFLARRCDDKTIAFVRKKRPGLFLSNLDETIDKARYDFEILSEPLVPEANLINCADEFMSDIWNFKESNPEELLNHKNLIINANSNMKDHEGWSPLHFCALKNNLELAEYLLLHGAFVNHKAKDGATALMIAKYNNHNDFIQLLIDCGAQV